MELLYVELFTVVYVVAEVYGRGCTDYNPIPGIVTCLSNITHGINNTNVLAGTKTGTIRAYCEEGMFRTSIECLETLYRDKEKCSSSDPGLQMPMRNSMPAVLTRSVQKICSSLPEHAKHSECIVEQRPLIHKCLGQNDVIFQQRQHDMTRPHTELSVADNMCRYYKGIEVCSSKYVEKRCDKDIGVLIGEFVRSVNPLNCSTLTTSRTSSSSSSLSSSCGSSYTHIFITALSIVSSDLIRLHR